MFENVRAVMAKKLNMSEDEITMDSDIKKDLKADSLDIMMMLMDMEDEYGITIPDEELETFEKVSDIVAFLEKVQK